VRSSRAGQKQFASQGWLTYKTSDDAVPTTNRQSAEAVRTTRNRHEQEQEHDATPTAQRRQTREREPEPQGASPLRAVRRRRRPRARPARTLQRGQAQVSLLTKVLRVHNAWNVGA